MKQTIQCSLLGKWVWWWHYMAPETPEILDESLGFTLQGGLLHLTTFRFTGTFTESRSLRRTLRKIDSLIRHWHWFSRSNRALLSFFINAKRPKISPLLQIHFRGLFSCQRLYLPWFGVLVSVHFSFNLSASSFTTEVGGTLPSPPNPIEKSISMISLSGINDLVSWSLTYSLRTLTSF